MMKSSRKLESFLLSEFQNVLSFQSYSSRKVLIAAVSSLF
jgi:hypothetical protein